MASPLVSEMWPVMTIKREISPKRKPRLISVLGLMVDKTGSSHRFYGKISAITGA